MRSAGVLGVLLAARLLVIAGGEAPRSAWAPAALLWQDLVVALLFFILDAGVRKPRLSWTLYWPLVLYTALNVPVARVLSTPLTPAMLRAARPTLADSIGHHLTAESLALVGAALFPAFLPFLVRRPGPPPRRLLLPVTAAGILAAGLGVWGASRVETGGLERNALVTLTRGFFPRLPRGPHLPGGPHLPSGREERDFRLSPFSSETPFPAAASVRPELPAPPEDLRRLSGAAAGRNVLLVVLESTGARHLRPHGAGEDPMPNLTRLAESAVLFRNAYAVYPESIKGLFTLLTSLAPALDVAAGAHGEVEGPSLPALLGREGYRTALFHSGRFRYLGMEAVLEGRGIETLEDAGHIGGNHRSSFGVDEPSAVKRILAWIDGLTPGERFFAAYLPVAGHHPYHTPARGPFPDAEEIDRYHNALHYADQALGMLLEGLRGRGLEEKTLLWVLSDHGEAFQEHPGNTGHTFFLYEENMHVPCLFALPGLLQEGLRVERVASLLDVAPTVLDLLGLPSPDAFQGRSLLEPRPLLALFLTDYSVGLLGLRDGRWKLIHELESGRSKLFDLEADPGERTDLAGRFPERAGAYQSHLVAWAAAQREVILGPAREARPAGAAGR